MAVGTVKWFNINKGYGFIKAEQGNDIFVHVKALHASGLDTLEDGQKVSYEIIKYNNKESASHLKLLNN